MIVIGNWLMVNGNGELGVVELGGREEHTTNNRMELTAAIKALEEVGINKEFVNREVVIYTDSKYLILGITAWIHNWKRNGWKKADKKLVENRDLWESLYSAAVGRNIQWKYVGGHKGIAGNERCDQIATGFADGGWPELFKGPLSDYPISNILDIK